MATSVKVSLSFKILNGAPSFLDYSSRLRSYQVNRGRSNDLDLHPPGTASIVLDNRDRALDAGASAGGGTVRPGNRVKIEATDALGTVSRFYGTVESWTQGYDDGGKDAIVILKCVDDLKLLATGRLPTTDPPASSYEDLIASEAPRGYWPLTNLNLNGNPGGSWQSAAAGNSPTLSGSKPIVGQVGEGLSLGSSSGWFITETDAFDFFGTSWATIEFWFRFAANPLGTVDILDGVMSSSIAGARTFSARMLSTGKLRFLTTNNAGANGTVDTTNALSTGVWHHIGLDAGKDSKLRIYVDGVLASTATGWTPPFVAGGAIDPANPPLLLFQAPTAFQIAHVALYPMVSFFSDRGGAARYAAHYNAGHSRGYVTQASGTRISGVLGDLTTTHPFTYPSATVDTGVRNVKDTYWSSSNVQLVDTRGADYYVRRIRGDGLPYLTAIQEAVLADNVNAAFFVKKDGELRYLDADHRSKSPWNTVQVIYGDSGSEASYQGPPALDYSDSFILNDVIVTAQGDGFTAQEVTDSTSLDTYGQHATSLQLPVTSDTDAQTIATALVAKYKNPFNRVLSFSPNMADIVTGQKTLRLELMDRIEFRLRPPGGGSPLDQTLFVQNVQESFNVRENLIRITLGVSPL